MSAPSTLPDEARAAAWRTLWDYLVLEASQELALDPTDEPIENDDSHDEAVA